MADRQVAKATRRGRDAAGGSWGRRKKMEEEEEEGEGRTKHLPADEDVFFMFNERRR